MTNPLFTKGRFVWADLVTREGAKARAFYTELMNWSATEMDMGPMGKYTMLKLGEQGIGGIPPVMKDMPADVPSHWMYVIATDDVDGACRKATELGGKVFMAGMDIPNVGRMAIVADPSGAVFSPFTPAPGSQGRPEGQPKVGEFCWYENFTTDVEKAKTFYATLFGWTWEKAPMPNMEYWIARRGDSQVAGVMKKPDEVPMANWLGHLLVENLERSTERATKLGGKKLMGPHDVPGIGTFTVVQDSAGAVVSLFQGASKA